MCRKAVKDLGDVPDAVDIDHLFHPAIMTSYRQGFCFIYLLPFPLDCLISIISPARGLTPVNQPGDEFIFIYLEEQYKGNFGLFQFE